MRIVVLIAAIGAMTAAADKQTAKEEALWEAAKAGDPARVAALLDEGVEVDAGNRYEATALSFAARGGHADVVALLIERGATVNPRDTFYKWTALDWSALRGHVEVVEVLLANGADGAADAVRLAAGSGHKEVVAAILDQAEIDKEELNKLVKRVPKEHREALVPLFVDAGADEPKPDDFPSGNAKIDAEIGSLLAGIYQHDSRGVLTIAYEDEQLKVTERRRSVYELRSVEGMTYRASDNREETFAFVLEGDEVARIEVRTPEAAYTFDPVDEGGMPADVETASHGDVTVREPANWPGFRGTRASGVADGQYPPLVWNAESGVNIRYRARIPGLGHACPIVWGDRVYLVTAVSAAGNRELRAGQYGDIDSVDDESVHTWKLLCLDKASGGVRFARDVYEGVPQVKRHLKSTHANATPVTDGARIVVSLGSEGLYCYGMEGELLWQRDLGELSSGWFFDDAYEWGFGSSPVIFQDLVVVQCDVGKDSFVAAYALSDGEEVWRTAREEIPSWSTPSLIEAAGRLELVTSGTGFTRSYDPATGEELWRVGPHSEVTVPTPISGAGLIFVMSGYRTPKPVYAIRPGASGDISLAEDEESNDYVAWYLKSDGPYLPSPIFYDGYLYICRNNGILTCYEPETGERVYRKRIGGEGGYTASPVAADGYLYFTSELGGTRVVKAGPEYELTSINPLGAICMTTPAISERLILIRTQQELLGIAEGGMAQPAESSR